MKRAIVHQAVAFLILGGVLITSVGVALAVTDTWYKNGSSMTGYHEHDAWIEPLQRRAKGKSSAQTPRGVIQHVYGDVRLQDRCKNADGSWQSWYEYGFGNDSADWAYSTDTYYGQGTYQDCFYGHQYRNKSYHYFYDSGFGLNEGHWLCSDTCS